MANAFFETPIPINEPILSYRPGSIERKELMETIAQMKSEEAEIPMTIGGQKVTTGNRMGLHPPHEHGHTLGHYHKGNADHVKQAIDAALAAKHKWENTPWHARAAIFLKAADLISGPYRSRMNAATMLGQSKNIYQAEIDCVAELADFFRFNVYFMTQIYQEQPDSSEGVWNRMEHRALEGFIFALTPFNFTAIAGNLPGAPAMMGNTIVWKPAASQIYSAGLLMEILEEAGLPAGVINLVFVDGPQAGDVILEHPDFAGLHFTGSTGVFQTLWQTIGNNIHKYRSYPRIVGETGGKDFVLVHPSSNAQQVATALVRGSFEFQGQKCSAASRAYIPASLWKEVESLMRKDVESFSIGTVEDLGNFINAVIDEKAFDKISNYIAKARESEDAEIIIGGQYDKSSGYFIQPTVIRAHKPDYVTMCEEIFGPVLTIYVYDDEDYEKMFEVVDNTSPYALTGSIFAKDRYVIEEAVNKLRHSAGNFYINDKPTGAVVGQQPFGGARGSGTNDKAGSVLNLYRWVSPRSIKENFLTPTDYRYPFLEKEE